MSAGTGTQSQEAEVEELQVTDEKLGGESVHSVKSFLRV